MLGAAAILATALATPAMSQEATQEPGMIGFNYPNSNYLRGGYAFACRAAMTTATTDLACTTDRVYYGPGSGPLVRWRRRNGGCDRSARRTLIPTPMMTAPGYW